MKPGDLVMLSRDSYPVIGEIVGLTKKRIRIAIKSGTDYVSLIRKHTTIQLAKKMKGLI